MLKLAFSLLTTGCLILAAAPASIGIVKSTGQFRVNGSAIRGNGNLFEGDMVETGDARSVVHVGTTQFILLPESRAHIFRDRTVLEKAPASSQALKAMPSKPLRCASLPRRGTPSSRWRSLRPTVSPLPPAMEARKCATPRGCS